MGRLLPLLLLGAATSAVAAPGALPAPEPLERCAQALGKSVDGATTLWRTELALDGNKVTGTETQLLLANPTWKTHDGADCSIIYKTTGTKGPAAGCPGCAYALTLSMTVDKDKSTCPDGLTPPDESDPDWSYDVTYQVSVEGAETVVRFASGTELGRGFSDKGSLAIQTAPRCRWF